MTAPRRERPEPHATTVVVDGEGVHALPPSLDSHVYIGWKAYGVSSIPADWTLPAVVVVADFVTLIDKIHALELFKQALTTAGIALTAPLIARSSASNETISARGQFESFECELDTLLATVAQNKGEELHWLVQERLPVRAKGHLSNERRLSKEPRDWVLEMEAVDGRASEISAVAVRQWRDGRTPSLRPLRAGSVAAISVALKQVALWASQFRRRFHLEWIWDGARVYVVQIDEEDQFEGFDPLKGVAQSQSSQNPPNLLLFRFASDQDFASVRKLRNANLYRTIGYSPPPFVVLAGATLGLATDGEGRVSLVADIVALTSRPFILRCEGLGIPDDKLEMLPRSDELRSSAEALDWLDHTLPARLQEIAVELKQVVLIGHHFIPASASAWARAEPGKPVIRIESLWGIPEGLYWHAHDTFEVDTGVVAPAHRSAIPRKRLPSSERLRYKGTVVAPDPSGRWIAQRVAQPHDWAPSIRSRADLNEIALMTKEIANREGCAVSVMWFIDTGIPDADSRLMPWFHSHTELSETPKAAPRQKYRRSSTVTIATSLDWNEFTRSVKAGNPCERVTVSPVDPELIRNPNFAKALGKLAKDNSIVVELAGGILSHAFYLLQMAGATVECIDLFGADEDIVEFDKLIRDRLAQSIAAKGERAEVTRLEGDALITALKQKLVEEALEVLDAASGEEIAVELADVGEVSLALARAIGLQEGRVEQERQKKRRARGGFDEGTMLRRTATPGSVHVDEDFGGTIVPPKSILTMPISDPRQLPKLRRLRRLDHRHINERVVERLLSFESDVVRASEVVEDMRFEVGDDSGAPSALIVTIEMRRAGTVIRTVIKVRDTDRQLSLGLEPPALSSGKTRGD